MVQKYPRKVKAPEYRAHARHRLTVTEYTKTYIEEFYDSEIEGSSPESKTCIVHVSDGELSMDQHVRNVRYVRGCFYQLQQLRSSLVLVYGGLLNQRSNV